MIKIVSSHVIPSKRQSISRITDDNGSKLGELIVTKLNAGGYLVTTKTKTPRGQNVTVEEILPETATAEDCVQRAISAVKTVQMFF